MNIKLDKKYLVVSDRFDSSTHTIILGSEITKWMQDSSLQAGDLIYELGDCFEVYNEKKIREKL